MIRKNNILSIRDLSVDFPVFGGVLNREVSVVHAVRNLSLDIEEGKTIGIVGESGSGKSTLGKAILNVLELTAPSVRISGEIILNVKGEETDLLLLNKNEMRKYRSDIQMIFQDPYSSLNPRMIVKDIIKEPMEINTNMSYAEQEEKVAWLMDKVGLNSEQSTRYPHEFSGGQRQRIGIARALATDPSIIIADEPVSALDVSIQAQVINLLMDLQEEFNLTILFIAHDLSVVQHISTDIAVMFLGEVVEYNLTNNIFSNPQHEYTKTLLASIPKPNPKNRDERKVKRKELKQFSQ